MIIDLISKLPDEDAVLKLLAMFDRMLKKYGRMLDYEDSYEDLRLFFLEVLRIIWIRKICFENDGKAVQYIVKAVKNRYYVLSKKHKKLPIQNFSDLSEEQYHFILSLISTTSISTISDYFPINNTLTENEKEIIILYYVHGYSSTEIAEKMNKTRQAVNQTKIRALRKIKRTMWLGEKRHEEGREKDYSMLVYHIYFIYKC